MSTKSNLKPQKPEQVTVAETVAATLADAASKHSIADDLLARPESISADVIKRTVESFHTMYQEYWSKGGINDLRAEIETRLERSVAQMVRNIAHDAVALCTNASGVADLRSAH